MHELPHGKADNHIACSKGYPAAYLASARITPTEHDRTHFDEYRGVQYLVALTCSDGVITASRKSHCQSRDRPRLLIMLEAWRVLYIWYTGMSRRGMPKLKEQW
jgi:hypothetical protein